MTASENRRDTGAAKYPARNAGSSDDFSQDAAGNTKPASGMGLTRPVGEVEAKTHQSDGQNTPSRATPSPATEKTSGAGPAISEHSKDAKAPKAGRQPGAYKKD
jgi:hypothetical protein